MENTPGSPTQPNWWKDASKIVSLLIENHAETLENLELLDNFDLTLTNSLQIKRFDAVNMSPQMVVSVLKLSQSSLEVLLWQRGEDGVSVNMETETYFKKEIKSLSLKLKVLDGVSRNDYYCHYCTELQINYQDTLEPLGWRRETSRNS
mgnify:CR=1 FL=1